MDSRITNLEISLNRIENQIAHLQSCIDVIMNEMGICVNGDKCVDEDYDPRYDD